MKKKVHTSEAVQVRLGLELHAALAAIAARSGRSVSYVIRRAVLAGIETAVRDIEREEETLRALAVERSKK